MTTHTHANHNDKLVLDCILNSDGTFNEESVEPFKTWSDEIHGNNEWSSQWDGTYNDQVKGSTAKQMQAGTRNNLTYPFGSSSSWEVACTMQLAIAPADDT